MTVNPGLGERGDGLVVCLSSGLLVAGSLGDVLGAVAVLHCGQDVLDDLLVVLDYVDKAPVVNGVDWGIARPG